MTKQLWDGGLRRYDREEVVERLCVWLCQGHAMTSFCKIEGNPSWPTIYGWIGADAEIARRIRNAQLAGTWVIVENLLEIADDASEDYVAVEQRDGTVKMQVVKENIARSRLRCDARWRLVACLGPQVWGSKLALATDNAQPLVIALTDAERLHKIQRLLGQAESRKTMARMVADPDDANEPLG